MRYFIEFSYHGKKYCGYQIQLNAPSVQETLEKSLSLILKESVKITGAGRTDTGVHAKKSYAHFDTETKLISDICYRLNAFLPPDIAIHRVFPVAKDLHARFSALSRTYEYQIALEKNPFLEEFSWLINKKKINVDLMNKACNLMMTYEDFECFSKVGADNKTTLCKIYSAHWREDPGVLIFQISANRFLRNMVRAIVGTMIEVGTEKIRLEDFCQIIVSKSRQKAGSSAPAQALFLIDITYPDV